MKTTQLVSFVGASALFLMSGCEDAAKIGSNMHSNSDSGAAVAGSGAVVPISMEFPMELLEGTPKPMPVPNLVPLPNRRPVVHVSEDTRLLSRGKSVTSSDGYPIIGTLDLVTDGDKDAGQGYFVDLDDGLQWIQIDLEERSEISVVWIWHDHSQRKAVYDVVVQVSDDPEFKNGVTSVFNNDYDGSTPFGIGRDHSYVESRYGKPIDGKKARGRYVRLYSSGSTYEEANRYIEVEVYGVPE